MSRVRKADTFSDDGVVRVSRECIYRADRKRRRDFISRKKIILSRVELFHSCRFTLANFPIYIKTIKHFVFALSNVINFI